MQPRESLEITSVYPDDNDAFQNKSDGAVDKHTKKRLQPLLPTGSKKSKKDLTSCFKSLDYVSHCRDQNFTRTMQKTITRRRRTAFSSEKRMLLYNGNKNQKDTRRSEGCKFVLCAMFFLDQKINLGVFKPRRNDSTSIFPVPNIANNAMKKRKDGLTSSVVNHGPGAY
jgi:hypothetical protein